MKRPLILSVFIAAVLAASAKAAEIGYYRQPALHGDRIVFVSEGDLWTATVPDDVGAEPIIAYRLTASDGSESHPRISPDGRSIAFAGQYDGNTDVYLMPVDGGEPKRLTFHPGDDVPLDWMPDGRSVLFRSGREHPFGRWELWRIATGGGMPERYAFGECSMVSLSPVGRRFAFTRWSNEHWTWKRYRGGTAPEIWVGDFAAESFTQLTDNRASDLFPMWLRGRVYFLSDRSNTYNIHSMPPEGGDVSQHTFFAADTDAPTAIDGYDIRWPSADTERRGRRIIFCQAGGLALFDSSDDRVTRLDVRLASDRIAARKRFAQTAETFSELALSPDGKTLLIGTRGELLTIDVESKVSHQLTRTSGAREWGATYLDEDRIALITDATGEPQVALMPSDGSDMPSLATDDREAWLFPPVASPDGMSLAFADKTMRLHVLDMQTLTHRQVDQAEAGEITDYRFSPDGQWLAYTKPMPNGMPNVFIYSLRAQRSFPVSDGMSADREPRWDPAGKYLYFLSERHFDPMLGRFDLNHIYVNATQVYAVPLTEDTPPPFPDEARRVEFDLKAWATPGGEQQPGGGGEDEDDDAEADAQPAAPAAAAEEDEAQPQETMPMRIDTEGLPERQYLLAIEPGNYEQLEALHGSITYLAQPAEGMLGDSFFRSGLGPGKGALYQFGFVKEQDKPLAEGISSYVVSRDGSTIAYPSPNGVTIKPVAPPGEDETITLGDVQVRVDVRGEWKQMFEEAWRLQRDFYWAPNMVGIDWPAMREKYAALLPRIGTRAELNLVIGELLGELGTSHSYVWGGRQHERATPDRVSVGLLGATVRFENGAFRIARILPAQPWSRSLRSPLTDPCRGVKEGDVLLEIDGRPLAPGMNVYDLLQDRAGDDITLTIADDALGTNRRTIEIEARGSEGSLRYAAWVEANRRYVAEASGGEIGYIHIPDMGGRGLATFSRQFFPQYNKRAFVIDVRDNGGGFVSQMIIERLARAVLAFNEPRHGLTERYPHRAPHAHMATLINQFAGSDGDIFPAVFRIADLGPLIGTRTWGGVVGIRADKPFKDLGLSTQPEFAWWWDEGGWTIENEGVSPDIQVDITPSDRIAERDPQLDRAIEYLKRKLVEDPKELPEAPPYPVRAPGS
ncbi:MAG: S41 family peptidase [Planctomycetota bacterium]|nr:S41 family peptidase [Planctomycetota bacterium]